MAFTPDHRRLEQENYPFCLGTPVTGASVPLALHTQGQPCAARLLQAE